MTNMRQAEFCPVKDTIIVRSESLANCILGVRQDVRRASDVFEPRRVIPENRAHLPSSEAVERRRLMRRISLVPALLVMFYLEVGRPPSD